jgi:hypothetical protein
MREPPKTIGLAPHEYRRLGERVLALVGLPVWRRILCFVIGAPMLAFGGWLLWVQVQFGPFLGIAIMGGGALVFGGLVLTGSALNGRPKSSGTSANLVGHLPWGVPFVMAAPAR